MPKVLPNVREEVLKKAKEVLFTQGYQSLAMRSVAESCGVAVGTLYNYFENKETMVAYIMLEDWKEAMNHSLVGVQEASSVEEGFCLLYETVESFMKLYRLTWNEYANVNSGNSYGMQYHHLLVGQIREIIQVLLERFHKEPSPSLSLLLAETLMSVLRNKDLSFDDFSWMLQKLFK